MPTGSTMRLPRTTVLPDWFQSVICELISGSMSIWASICAGPRLPGEIHTLSAANNWLGRFSLLKP